MKKLKCALKNRLTRDTMSFISAEYDDCRGGNARFKNARDQEAIVAFMFSKFLHREENVWYF